MKKQISKCVKMLFLGIIMCLGMALSVHAEGSGQFFQFDGEKWNKEEFSWTDSQGQIWLRNAHGTQKMEHTVHLEHFTLSDIIAIIQIHDPNNIIFLATIISSAFMKNKIATVTENKITIPNFLSPIQMTNGENSVGTSL